MAPQEPNDRRHDSVEPAWRQVMQDLVKDSNPEIAQQAAAALEARFGRVMVTAVHASFCQSGVAATPEPLFRSNG